MNLVETGLAFVEGLALIASPCILPVLPLVLAASVDGGRRRPFGIILGFVVSFTLFALLSRELVETLDLDLDYLKYGSLFFLALFGIVLLSEKLSQKFNALTQGVAQAGSNLTAQAPDGFGSGVLIGLLIGLVWTPCAGPILASVLVQVIRQESDLGSLFILGSFALGAGIPMLIIALAGKQIMSKLSFFVKHAADVRKAFGVILLLAVAFIASGADVQSYFSKHEESAVPAEGLVAGLEKPYPAPEIVGIDTWLNTKPLTIKSLKGKVVLIDFWTYSCINCVRTLPYLTKWDQAYRDKGLVIIGMHSPEFEFEKKKANVETAVAEFGIEYPVALDNKLDTWTAFKNRYWPAHYLIDKDGRVVYTHVGEGNFMQTENNIRHLLGIDKQATDEPAPSYSTHQTPETYLGTYREQKFHSKDMALKNGISKFEFPPELPLHEWALNGTWKIGGERISSASAGASLRLHFNARKVFLILGTETPDKAISVSIKLNGEPLKPEQAGADAITGSPFYVDRHTLYALIDQKERKEGLLEITSEEPGLEAFAFTFGE